MENGVPLADDLLMSPGNASDQNGKASRALIGTLAPGITLLVLNPPGDIEAIVPPRAHFRTDEYRLPGNGRVTEWLDGGGIEPTAMRAVRDLYREARETAGDEGSAAGGDHATASAPDRRLVQ